MVTFVWNWKYLLVFFLCKIGDAKGSKQDELPHLMKCMDAACKGSISQAWTKDVFETAEEHILSFKKSELVEVLGKPTDDGRLWLGKLFHSGEKGFVLEDRLKEILVFEHVPPEVVPLEIAYPEIKQAKPESTDEGNSDKVQENPGNQGLPEDVLPAVDQADAKPAGDLEEEKKEDARPLDNEGNIPSAETGDDLLKQNEPTPDIKEEPQQSDPATQTDTSGKDEKHVGEGAINMVQSPGIARSGGENSDDGRFMSESSNIVDKSVSAQIHDMGHGAGDKKDAISFKPEGEKKEQVPELVKEDKVLVGEVSTKGGEELAHGSGGEGEQKMVQGVSPSKEAKIDEKHIKSEDKLKEGYLGKETAVPLSESENQGDLPQPETKHIVGSPVEIRDDKIDVINMENKINVINIVEQSVDVPNKGEDVTISIKHHIPGPQGITEEDHKVHNTVIVGDSVDSGKPDEDMKMTEKTVSAKDEKEVQEIFTKTEPNVEIKGANSDITQPEIGSNDVSGTGVVTESSDVNSEESSYPEKSQNERQDNNLNFVKELGKDDGMKMRQKTVNTKDEKEVEEIIKKTEPNVETEGANSDVTKPEIVWNDVSSPGVVTESSNVNSEESSNPEKSQNEKQVNNFNFVKKLDKDDGMKMIQKTVNTKDEKEVEEIIKKTEPNVENEGANSDITQPEIGPNDVSGIAGIVTESSNVNSEEFSNPEKSQDEKQDNNLNFVKELDKDDGMKMDTKDEKEVEEIIKKTEPNVEIEGANIIADQPKTELNNVSGTRVVSESSDANSEKSSIAENSQDEKDANNLNSLKKLDKESMDGKEDILEDKEKMLEEDKMGRKEKRKSEKDEILQREQVAAAEISQQNENGEKPKFDFKVEVIGDKMEGKRVEDDVVGKKDDKVDLSIKLENQKDVEEEKEKEKEKVKSDEDVTDKGAEEGSGQVVEIPTPEMGEETMMDETKVTDPGVTGDSKMEGENNHQPSNEEINPDNNVENKEKNGLEEEVKSLEKEEQKPDAGQDLSNNHPAEEIKVDEKEQVGKVSTEGNIPSDAGNFTPSEETGAEGNGKSKDSSDQPAIINEEYDSGIEEDLDEEEENSDEEREEEDDEDSKEVISDGQDSSTVSGESVTDKFQDLNPDEIQPTPQYEVIDGTTLYFDDDSDFTFDQGKVEVQGDQLQPSPAMSTNQGPIATPSLPADALSKDEGETEKEENSFLSNNDDLALANVRFAKWLTVPGNLDILFDELAAGNLNMRNDQTLLREELNAMMNDPEWKKQVMKNLWHHFGEDESVKDMFGSYDGDDEIEYDDEDYFEEELPPKENPSDPASLLQRETLEGTELPDNAYDPYNFNSVGGEDAKKEEEVKDYFEEEKRENEGMEDNSLSKNEKIEDTTQTPQLQTDYPPPLADYPDLPEGFSSYTEAPETEESPARNFTISLDEMAEMIQTNMQALYHVFSEAVIPLVAMLPDEMKEVVNQPTFFGIAWTTLVWFQISLTSLIGLLFCGCACCAQRNRALQRELMTEVQMLTEQKAKALDALKTTTKHFSDQNTEYFNYQQLTKDVEKEKKDLKALYEELKEEKEKQDEKLAEMENMNIQQQEELDGFKQQVQHHGNVSDKAKNQMQKMQKKINELETKLRSHRDDALSLRQDIDSLTKENKVLLEVKDQLTSDVKEHADKLEALTENAADLETENKTLKETVNDKDNEIEVLKDCLVQLKGLEDYGEGTEVDNEARIQQLLDVNRANAKITLLEDERKTLEEKMEEESRKIHNLEDDNRTLRKEMEGLQQECKKTKEDHEEARTKLDVLTEYFKGKEVEMQRKLGKEEALKFHSQKELDSLGEKTAAAEAEVANYKQQIQDLKDEIEKSERSFRQQIAAHEKKAHESWMTSRNAERKLKETNKEIASLRQRLTELQGRKKTDAAPLIKPSPERKGSPSNVSEASMVRRDQPSRNSILEDAPSPPMIGGQRYSPGEKDRPPSRPVRVSRSGRPPSFHEDFFPPEDMMPPPDGMPFRGPPSGFHPGMDPYGPPPPMDGSFMPPDMEFDRPPGPPPPDMGYGPPGPYDFGPRGPPLPSMGGDPRFPPPFMGPHPDDFPPDGPYGAMDPGMGPPPPFRGPPPDWNDRIPHPSMRGPPPPGGDPRTSRPVSRGGPPPPSHIQPDQGPRSSTPVDYIGEPQNQGTQNQNRRPSNIQP